MSAAATTPDFLQLVSAALEAALKATFTGLVAARGRLGTILDPATAAAGADPRLTTRATLAVLRHEQQTGAIAAKLGAGKPPWSRTHVQQVLAAVLNPQVFLQMAGEVAGPLTLGILPGVIEALTGELAEKEKMAFDRWLFEQQTALQEKLARENRAHQEQLARYQRESLLKAAEAGKLFENWPLTLVPSQILNAHHTDQPPLRIFHSPPELAFDRFGRAERGLAALEGVLNDRLRAFLANAYPVHQEHSAEFLAGAWDSKRFRSEASIRALFGMLHSEPTLILEWDAIGDQLSLRIAYWGLGQATPTYTTLLSRLPVRDLLESSARQRARAWQPVYDALAAQGRDAGEIDRLGGARAANVRTLKGEEALAGSGIDPRTAGLTYQIDDEDLSALGERLAGCLCLVTGWVLDAHYLVHADQPPRLPAALPVLGDAALAAEVLQPLVIAYEDLYRSLATERPNRLPTGLLDLARTLAALPDPGHAGRVTKLALTSWLALHRPTAARRSGSAVTLRAADVQLDPEFFAALAQLYTTLGDSRRAARVNRLLAAPPAEPATSPEPAPPDSPSPPAQATLPPGKPSFRRFNPAPVYSFFVDGRSIARVAIDAGSNLLFVLTWGKKGDVRDGIKVRDLATGHLLRTISMSSFALSQLAPVKPVTVDSGRTLLVAGANGMLAAFDLATGAERWHSTPWSLPRSYTFFEASPDFHWLLTLTSNDEHVVRIVNTITGKEIRSKNLGDATNHITFSHNLRFLALGGPGRSTTAGIYELPSLQLLRPITRQGATPVAITGEGDELISIVDAPLPPPEWQHARLAYHDYLSHPTIIDHLATNTSDTIAAAFLDLARHEAGFYASPLNPNTWLTSSGNELQTWEISSARVGDSVTLKRPLSRPFWDRGRTNVRGRVAGSTIATETVPAGITPQLSLNGAILADRNVLTGDVTAVHLPTGAELGTLTLPAPLQEPGSVPPQLRAYTPSHQHQLIISADGATIVLVEQLQDGLTQQAARITAWRPFSEPTVP